MTNVFDLLPGDPYSGALRRNGIAAGAGAGGTVLDMAGSLARRAGSRYTDIARDDDGQVRGRVRTDPASGRRVLDATELRARIDLRSTEPVEAGDWERAAEILAGGYPIASEPEPEPAPEPVTTGPEASRPAAPRPGSWLRSRR